MKVFSYLFYSRYFLFPGPDQILLTLMDDLETPLHFFSYFFPESLFIHIVEEIRTYATQKNIAKTFRIDVVDLKRFVGICILTLIVHVANVQNYWKNTIEV